MWAGLDSMRMLDRSPRASPCIPRLRDRRNSLAIGKMRKPKRVRLATILPFTAGTFLGTLITLFLLLTLRSIEDETAYIEEQSAGVVVMPSTPRIIKHSRDVHPTREGFRRELVLYSVLVHKSQLKTRGLASHKTWASDLGNRVKFYQYPAGGDEEVNFALKARMPLINLDSQTRRGSTNTGGVMKSLLDVCRRELGRYQWYAKIDDVTYVLPSELESVLVTLNSSEPHFIGHQVLPEGRKREELGLREGEGYCMEMGYVMSAATLEQVCPMLEHCQENARSDNEDVELARCVRLATGVNCTSSQEVYITAIIIIHNNKLHTYTLTLV